jgi:hypothetical protein
VQVSMKRLVTVLMLMSGALAAGTLRCEAQAACAQVTVEARVEAGPGALTLANLLGPGTCLRWRRAAERVNLGAAPRAGSERVFDGRQVRRLLEELEAGGVRLQEAGSVQVPERIVVKRAGATKSCAEIARFVAGAARAEDMAGAPAQWQKDLDCAAARGIPEGAALELTKTAWNAVRERWEFALRCVRPEDCVPFLVWADLEKAPQSGAARRLASYARPKKAMEEAESAGTRLVKPGQTATLTWDEAGIRIVLPVTCLDGGGLGQFVRVRFKNTPRTLRAEVVGAGLLRASL